MKCKVCGFRLSEEAKKCPMCGTMKGSTKAGSMGAENANLPRYFCPSCKADIIGEHRFCPSCGKELSEVANMQDTKEQSKNNCLKCGAYLPLNARFCHKCGAKQGTNCYKCGAILQSNAEFCNECGAKQNQTRETPMEAFEYEVRNGKYILIGVKDTSLTDIVIPHVFSEIEGKKIKFRNGEYSYHSAFDNCKKLTSVTIPNSITKIGKFAFYSCSSLTSVTIPNSVTEIGELAFVDCSGLTTVVIPNSVTEIGAWAFDHCSSLTSITIPNYITKIRGYAFSNCSSLTSITVPNSVTEIGMYAFSGCNFLKNVSIENPNFKKSDIERVFGYLPSFKKIKIGNNIVKVSEL